jgi:phage terminase large subunit-like protein
MAWWDGCIDANLRPVISDPNLQISVGVDASVKRDSTAIVCCTYDEEKKLVRLVWHKVFQPSPEHPLDFEATIERTLLDLRERFYVAEIRYDPYQLVAVSQRLAAQGLPMVEFPQTLPNLTEASSNLFELLKSRNLAMYPDAEMRLAASRAVAIESSRGWRIGKEKQAHKIDSIVALAQAALGCVKQAGSGTVSVVNFWSGEKVPDVPGVKRAGTGDVTVTDMWTGRPVVPDVPGDLPTFDLLGLRRG